MKSNTQGIQGLVEVRNFKYESANADCLCTSSNRLRCSHPICSHTDLRAKSMSKTEPKSKVLVLVRWKTAGHDWTASSHGLHNQALTDGLATLTHCKAHALLDRRGCNQFAGACDIVTWHSHLHLGAI